MIGEFSRKLGFWTVDFLKGSKVRKEYKNVKNYYERGDQSELYKKLEDILTHAMNTVDYYKNRQVDVKNLKSFPVVNKEIYKKNYNDFLSQSFNYGNLVAKYTGGSTGEPFKALWNEKKINRHKANLIYLNQSIGWNIGNKFMFIRHWGNIHTRSKLEHFVKNTIPVDSASISDHLDYIENFLIKKKNIKHIQGYSSSLNTISIDMISKGYKPNDFSIQSIISDTDTLTKNTKEQLARLFNVPVYDRYGNNENGILAISDDSQSNYYVNHSDFLIEILKLDSDHPALIGEKGRIVITDFHNFAFPFIRYDTGDIAVPFEKKGNYVTIISSLSGRSVDYVLSQESQKIHEMDIVALFEDLTEITKFQLIQQSPMKFTLNVIGDVQKKEIIRGRLKKVLGEAVDIHIVCVNQIPVEANGKYKIIKRHF